MIEVGKAQEGISLENSGPGDVDEGPGDSLSGAQRTHWATVFVGSLLEMGKLASS